MKQVATDWFSGYFVAWSLMFWSFCGIYHRNNLELVVLTVFVKNYYNLMVFPSCLLNMKLDWFEADWFFFRWKSFPNFYNRSVKNYVIATNIHRFDFFCYYMNWMLIVVICSFCIGMMSLILDFVAMIIANVSNGQKLINVNA